MTQRTSTDTERLAAASDWLGTAIEASTGHRPTQQSVDAMVSGVLDVLTERTEEDYVPSQAQQDYDEFMGRQG